MWEQEKEVKPSDVRRPLDSVQLESSRWKGTKEEVMGDSFRLRERRTF